MTRPKPTVDLGYPTEARGAIPSFKNIEEEAEWWDTHDADGYPVEFDDVLTVRLDESEQADLVKFAHRKGIGPSTLARMWIKEHLEEEAAREAKAS
jgi:hypothetical protein